MFRTKRNGDNVDTRGCHIQARKYRSISGQDIYGRNSPFKEQELTCNRPCRLGARIPQSDRTIWWPETRPILFSNSPDMGYVHSRAPNILQTRIHPEDSWQHCTSHHQNGAALARGLEQHRKEDMKCMIVQPGRAF